MTVVPVTSADLDAVEVAWFAALCSDDYRHLGVPDGSLRSSWAHCSDIVRTAEQQGFGNILCPSSYQVGQDTLSFVAGCAPITAPGSGACGSWTTPPSRSRRSGWTAGPGPSLPRWSMIRCT